MEFALNDFDAALLADFSEGMTFASLRASRHRGPDPKPGVYAVVYPFRGQPKFRGVVWLRDQIMRMHSLTAGDVGLDPPQSSD